MNVDKAHKLIRDYEVTDAAVHDSRVFETLLDKSNTSKDVFGDSAYQSAEAEEKLAARGFRNRICVRGARGRPLSAAAQAANRTKSCIRARIEQRVRGAGYRACRPAGAHHRDHPGARQDRAAEPRRQHPPVGDARKDGRRLNKGIRPRRPKKHQADAGRAPEQPIPFKKSRACSSAAQPRS